MGPLQTNCLKELLYNDWASCIGQTTSFNKENTYHPEQHFQKWTLSNWTKVYLLIPTHQHSSSSQLGEKTIKVKFSCYFHPWLKVYSQIKRLPRSLEYSESPLIWAGQSWFIRKTEEYNVFTLEIWDINSSKSDSSNKAIINVPGSNCRTTASWGRRSQ